MPEKPTTAAGYPPDQVARVKATCLYLATKLGDLMPELVVVGGMARRLLERLPRMEQTSRQAPVGDIVIADDDEGRLGHPADPFTGGGELIREALLGDVAGDQHQIGLAGMGVFQSRLAGPLVLATEVDVGKLEDQAH